MARLSGNAPDGSWGYRDTNTSLEVLFIATLEWSQVADFGAFQGMNAVQT